jgi:serine/threonine-protein kinase HipA
MTPKVVAVTETAILEGGVHDRSIGLALEACEFFEVPDAKARQVIRQTAERVSAGWRDAFKQVGVTGSLARDYEPAFAHEDMEIALGM